MVPYKPDEWIIEGVVLAPLLSDIHRWSSPRLSSGPMQILQRPTGNDWQQTLARRIDDAGAVRYKGGRT
jgi:hypothetical protein